MTDTAPTPAETALWRALNREPGQFGERIFSQMHPADRLAYFEGKVRERCAYRLNIDEEQDGDVSNWHVVWKAGLYDALHDPANYATEHLARFHASARALNALGVITDDVMKEIEEHG